MHGSDHRLFVYNPGTKATVAIFLMTDCPVANAMLPDLNEMAKRYEPLGIRFYGIYADQKPESILRHSEEYQIAFPCLLDDHHQLAKISKASRVPEVAIFGPDGAPLYCGRIDDRAVKVGRIKPVPAQRNLNDALEALVAGTQLPPPQPVTAGCYLSID
jgi:thiol-disulfide isomerase/thioredoxin